MVLEFKKRTNTHSYVTTKNRNEGNLVKIPSLNGGLAWHFTTKQKPTCNTKWRETIFGWKRNFEDLKKEKTIKNQRFVASHENRCYTSTGKQ